MTGRTIASESGYEIPVAEVPAGERSVTRGKRDGTMGLGKPIDRTFAAGRHLAG